MNKVELHQDTIYSSKAKKDITIIHLADIHFNTNTKDKKLNLTKEDILEKTYYYKIIKGNYLTLVNRYVDVDDVSDLEEVETWIL